MQNLCMLETNIIRGATQIDLRSSFSYTNIYAALVTDAEAVDPYWKKRSGSPSKVHSAILFISHSHHQRLSEMGKKSLLLFFNGLIYWYVS